ncbi:MAG: hypothetical protein FWG73_02220 [Planctomycetaceae bacterium]|nr:hypothetical protein [Planctomycetaceae bacterium]
MIVSPRAEKVIDIVRKEVVRNEDGSVKTVLFIEVDEAFLYYRANADRPYTKIPYWKRGEDASNSSMLFNGENDAQKKQ